MVIRSKFKDYYDSSAAWGVDTSIVFERESEVVDLKDILSPSVFNKYANRTFKAIHPHKLGLMPLSSKVRLRGLDVVVDNSILYFCGESFFITCLFYRGSHYTDSIKLWHIVPFEGLSEKDFIRNFMSDVSPYAGKKDIEGLNTMASYIAYCYTKIKIFYQEVERDLNEYRVKHRVPYSLIGYNPYSPKLIFQTNPKLKNIGFTSVYNSEEVHQKVSQYLSGVLVDTEESIEPSDKVKIANRGFDERSFRKDKGLKKRGRRKGK